MIAQLESSGSFKVLRRFEPVMVYNPVDFADNPLIKVCVIDSETTGLDTKTNKLIELGYVVANVDRVTGEVFDVVATYSGLQDPGEPLTDDVKAVTGLTDEELAGQSLNREQIASDLSGVKLFVAHNAPFDREVMERHFPELGLESSYWACSQRDCPWVEMRTGSVKLEWLVFLICGMFYDAHRALVDAQVLLHLLSHKGVDDQTIMYSMLNKARVNSYRVWATGAPIALKDVLKKNGYKWSDGSDPEYPIKAWHKEIQDLEMEKTWLLDNIYLSKHGGQITVDTITARERHTPRHCAREEVEIRR